MSARSLNKVMLIRELNPRSGIRYTPRERPSAPLAWRPIGSGSMPPGQKQESAEFHNLVAWTKLAEICSQLLFKGRKVYVSGRLQTRNWQGQDGAERSKTEVIIDEMIAFGEGKGGGQQMDESYAPETTADEASQVFSAEEAPAEASKKNQ